MVCDRFPLYNLPLLVVDRDFDARKARPDLAFGIMSQFWPELLEVFSFKDSLDMCCLELGPG